MIKDKNNLITRIKEIYSRGENIIQFLKNEEGRDLNTIEDILISYEFQAGSYIRYAAEYAAYNDSYTWAIANVLGGLGKFATLMKVGVRKLLLKWMSKKG